MPETGWVDIYHPDFWDPDDEDSEKPEPGNPEHDGRWSRVTRESYDLNWSKKGWELVHDHDAPSPVGSLQADAQPLPAPADATSEEEDPTPKKSSSSRKSAAKN